MKLFHIVLFLKLHPRNYATAHAFMISKKNQRSNTVQEEGLTNESRQTPFVVIAQASV